VSGFIGLTGGIVSYFSSLYLLPIIAASIIQPRTGSDRRVMETYSAFIVALLTEMYGAPVTIYVLSGWLAPLVPGLVATHTEGSLDLAHADSLVRVLQKELHEREQVRLGHTPRRLDRPCDHPMERALSQQLAKTDDVVVRVADQHLVQTGVPETRQLVNIPRREVHPYDNAKTTPDPAQPSYQRSRGIAAAIEWFQEQDLNGPGADRG